MPFRWCGVSALSWVADESPFIELGYVSWLESLSLTHATECCTQSLGSRFWACILGRIQVSQLHAPLRDGAYSGQSSSAGSTYGGAKVPYGFALSAASESAAALHEAWKGDTLTRAILRDYSSARLDNFFESRALARDTVALFSLLSSACVFLSSRLSSGVRVSSGRSPLRASSSPRVPVVAEFPLGSTISGEIADFSGFSPAARGKEIFEDCPAPGDGKVSTQSLQPAGRVSILSSVGPPHWIQTNWILLGWWLRYLVLGL